MASQAYLDMVNGKQGGVTRQGLLKDIYDSINREHSYMLVPYSGTTFGGESESSRGARANAIYEANRQNQLKYLLNAGTNSGAWNEDGSAGGGGNSANPFSTGGSGAPTVNTSNRFETGLSDAEQRLKNLLDNPDSITQSAAYKFRVGQGQEALQRSLGAKGLLNSGNRLMELTKYGQDMGAQEYDAQAGRLGSLLGNYSQSWIGDKNANTGLFNAQANAWNNAQANADRTRLGYADIAAQNSRAAMHAQASMAGRSSGAGGGGSTAGLYDQTQPTYNDDFFKIKQDSNSWWDQNAGQRMTNYWDQRTGKTWTGSADMNSNYGRNPKGDWR